MLLFLSHICHGDLVQVSSFMMLSLLVASGLVLPFAGVFAKPEQIRAVQDPIFHYYLQSYPSNGKLHFVFLSLFHCYLTHLQCKA